VRSLLTVYALGSLFELVGFALGPLLRGEVDPVYHRLGWHGSETPEDFRWYLQIGLFLLNLIGLMGFHRVANRPFAAWIGRALCTAGMVAAVSTLLAGVFGTGWWVECSVPPLAAGLAVVCMIAGRARQPRPAPA